MNPRLDFHWRRLRVIVSLWFNRRDRALAMLEAMAERHPGTRFPLATRAHLLAQMQRHDAAVQAHHQLLALSPEDAVAWFNLGYLHEDKGRWLEALDAFERATELDVKLDRAWYGLGLVLIRLGRLDEAVRAFKHNTELQPMSPYGWYQLARVQIDRKQTDEAVKIIHHLRGFEPKVAAQLERETGLIVGQPAT